VTEYFSTIMEKVRAELRAIQEDKKQKEEMLAQESAKLVDLVARYRQVEAELESPLPGTDISTLRQVARNLAEQVQDQEWIVDMLDGAENPAEMEMGEDPFADNTSQIEVPGDAPPLKRHPAQWLRSYGLKPTTRTIARGSPHSS